MTDKKTTRSEGIAAVVSRQYLEGKQVTTADTKNEVMEVRTFLTEPAKVHVSKGLTLNLGNFESARIDVSVAVPCYLEELDAAYRFADNWVETRLEVERNSVRKNKPGIF
jgi:hypothetical protein